MPGPVSDSFDPEFGTGANARDVEDAINDVCLRISNWLGHELKNIVEVAHGDHGLIRNISFSEKELRVIRFCLDRAKESI